MSKFFALLPLAEGAAGFDPTATIEGAMTSAMGSMTGLIGKMIPYVVGIALLGVGIGLVTKLTKKGGSSIK